MTQLFREVVDPGALPPADPSGRTERTQDRRVEALRDIPVAQVLADYRSLGEQAIVTLDAMRVTTRPSTSATWAPIPCI